MREQVIRARRRGGTPIPRMSAWREASRYTFRRHRERDGNYRSWYPGARIRTIVRPSLAVPVILSSASGGTLGVPTHSSWPRENGPGTLSCITDARPKTFKARSREDAAESKSWARSQERSQNNLEHVMRIQLGFINETQYLSLSLY